MSPWILQSVSNSRLASELSSTIVFVSATVILVRAVGERPNCTANKSNSFDACRAKVASGFGIKFTTRPFPSFKGSVGRRRAFRSQQRNSPYQWDAISNVDKSNRVRIPNAFSCRPSKGIQLLSSDQIGALRWLGLENQLHATSRELNAARKEGRFLWKWRKWQDYDIDVEADLIVGKGESTLYFSAPTVAMLDQLYTVSDDKSLLKFARKFGLLGCSKTAGSESNQAEHHSDSINSIELCLAHAETVRVLRDLIGALHQAERDLSQRPRLGAEIYIAEVRRHSISLGDGRIGYQLVGAKRQFTELRKNPFNIACGMIQSLIDMNTNGIRPFLFFANNTQPEIWFAFDSLYELAYWKLALDAADHRIRKCRRVECGRIFKANRNKQVYCSRDCLDTDKQRRYNAKKRSKQ